MHRDHDEVPEEHGDVGHQGADPCDEPEEQTDQEKTAEKLDEKFHEMFDAFYVRVVSWDLVSHLMN